MYDSILFLYEISRSYEKIFSTAIILNIYADLRQLKGETGGRACALLISFRCAAVSSCCHLTPERASPSANRGVKGDRGGAAGCHNQSSLTRLASGGT
jgi:hypothetical protein